ncbi:MAG: hypothetical protein ACK5LX_05205 [Oscillospiraceae bacterium]
MKTKIFPLRDFVRINGLDGSLVEHCEMADAVYSDAVELIATRNSTVSFQIAVLPESGTLSSLSIRSSSLTSGDGESIPAENLDFFTQWFHRVDDLLVPDLLIPLMEGFPTFQIPMDGDYLPDQRAGAVWVDLWIPADFSPGRYKGTIRVTADGAETEIILHCEVTDIVLPDKPAITADLNNYADSISPAFSSLRDNPQRYRDGSYFGVEREFYRMAREHRGLFHNLPYRHSGHMPESFAPELEGEGKSIRVKNWESFDRHFGPYFDGSAFHGCRGGEHPVEFAYLPFHLGWPGDYAKWGKKGYRTEYRRILAEFVCHFEEKGWDSTVFEILLNHKKDYRFYPYTVDEIWYDHDQDVVDTYYDVIRDIFDTSSGKFVLRMDSSNHYGNHFDHRFSDYCGMWVAGWAMFNWFPESVPVMREKGNILWIYGSVLQSLEEPLTSLFVWPMQALMTGATGFTVWNTNGFGDDPLLCPAARGGEALFYPGSHFGIEAPLPSIRLKALRNAMQTAELAATAIATPMEPLMRKLINEAFGFERAEDWFCPKPDFVDTPPRYWDHDKKVQESSMPPLYLDRPCDFAAVLSRRLLLAASGRADHDGAEGPNFKFQ